MVGTGIVFEEYSGEIYTSQRGGNGENEENWWLTRAQRDDAGEGDDIVARAGWVRRTTRLDGGRGSTVDSVWIVCGRGQREGEDEGKFLRHCERRWLVVEIVWAGLGKKSWVVVS